MSGTRKRLTLLAFMLGAGCGDQTPTESPVLLTDHLGREIVLHGLNLSGAHKNSPTGFAWHTEADFARMRDEWGLNAVRLVLGWSKLEPQRDTFSRAYLDDIEVRLDWAEAHGLHVLLDFHQDLWGPAFGSNGAPVWATMDGGFAYTPVDPWWFNYLSPAVGSAFSALWTNDRLQHEYFDAWAEVATRFGDHPAVIGYDLMNEPWYGFEWPLTFEAERLLPFYKGCLAAIRAVDPDATIFFEPPAFPTASGLASQMPAFGDENVVYVPHYYDPLVHEGIAYLGATDLLDQAIANKAAEAQMHGAPLVIGEFGGLSTAFGFESYLQDLMTAFDRHAAGWMAWDYDKDDGGGFGMVDSSLNVTPNLVPLIRVYPSAVAGRIESYSFDHETREFTLDYASAPSAFGPTVISVPDEWLYAAGFQVTSTDAPGTWSWAFDDATNMLSVWHDPFVGQHTVRVTP